MQLHFSIVTPEGPLYENEVDSVTVPTVSGVITVLPQHIPLVSLLAPGELMYRYGGDDYFVAVSSGIVEVRSGSQLVILADSAERAEHIDLERAEAARQRAAALLEDRAKLDNESFALVQAQLEKEIARLNVGRKYRRLPPR